MISQYIGAGRRQEAQKMLNQIFVCAMGMAAVCVTAIFALTPAIVRWLGAEGETYRHSVAYLRLVIADMPFLFIVNLYQASRQAQGDTVRPMFLKPPNLPPPMPSVRRWV